MEINKEEKPLCKLYIRCCSAKEFSKDSAVFIKRIICSEQKFEKMLQLSKNT